MPIGLFFGRVANFVNGELWGRPTDVPWAIVFPGAGGAAPSEPALRGGLEGLVLFVILFVLLRLTRIRDRPGRSPACSSSAMPARASSANSSASPMPFLGFLWFGATMGQLLSIPVLLLARPRVVRLGATRPGDVTERAIGASPRRIRAAGPLDRRRFHG